MPEGPDEQPGLRAAPVNPRRAARARARSAVARRLRNLGSFPTRAWRLVAAWLLLVAALTAAHALLTWRLNAETGLTQTCFDGVGERRALIVERRVPAVDLGIFDDLPRLQRGVVSIRWNGVWSVPRQGFFDINATSDGRVTVTIDGLVAQRQVPGSPPRNPRTIFLDAGLHPIEVDYEHLEGTPTLAVTWAPSGELLQPLDPAHLFHAAPAHPPLHALRGTTRSASRILGLAGLAVLLWAGLARLVRVLSGVVLARCQSAAVRVARRIVVVGLPILVVAYGATLRLDALTATRGAVERPAWLRSLQLSRGPSSVIRPAAVNWAPVTGRYISDPYTYLQYARAMRSFYAAHRREPGFPLATKVFLHLLHQQDVAVSFASAFFSVLAVAGTFLLGAYAFSYWVGLGAALAMAVEYDVISWAVGGWRDDAFTCGVVFSAYAMLRYSRDTTKMNAVLMGVMAGAACLVRITSLSFLLPGFAALALTAGRTARERVAGIGLGVLIMTLLVGPFLFNCWRTFGDPLYAINVHANVYRAAEGQAERAGLTAASYLGAMAGNRPFQTLDTVALGLTAYPFQNKWHGFDPWMPGLAGWLARASLLGLFLFAGTTPGRFLLVVLGASLVPYAATWKLIADWRFTAHAYPIFLIAACYAVGRIVAMAGPRRIASPPEPLRWTRLVPWALTAGCVGFCVSLIAVVLPVQTARESLLAGEPITITAGNRDWWFLSEGWSGPLAEGNVTARVTRGPFSVVRLYLPRRQDYTATFRLDPFPRPLDAEPVRLPALRVFLNGSLVARLDLRWNPDRVGSYDVRLPGTMVRKGLNRIELLVEAADSIAPSERALASSAPGGGRVRLWYVRIRP